MKYLIASDIHGVAPCCEQLLKAIEREQLGKILLLGDILYHGPRNGVPEGYDPVKVIDMLNPLAENILCVRGNCDAEVDQMVLKFELMTDYMVLPFENCTVFATHGHHYNTVNPPLLPKNGILLHGHTHVAALEEHEGYVYMNPGSVSLPKQGTRRGYMTFNGSVFLWKDLDGNVYQSYTP